MGLVLYLVLIKPFLFAHLVCNNSPLCNVDPSFLRQPIYETNLTGDQMKLFLSYLIKCDIPTLSDLIENQLIEVIYDITGICNYFNISIYVDYFNQITNNILFGQLFLE